LKFKINIFNDERALGDAEQTTDGATNERALGDAEQTTEGDERVKMGLVGSQPNPQDENLNRLEIAS